MGAEYTEMIWVMTTFFVLVLVIVFVIVFETTEGEVSTGGLQSKFLFTFKSNLSISVFIVFAFALTFLGGG